MKVYEFGDNQLFLILYRHVNNVKSLQEDLLKGELDCALIKATLIYDPLQVAVAATKSYLNKQQQKMVTKNLYTETLFNLSTSRNITQSLKTFGIDYNKDTDLIVTHFGDSVSLNKITSMINGDQVDWNQLEDIRKQDEIKRIYSIKNDSVSEVLDSVITRIAVKSLE